MTAYRGVYPDHAPGRAGQRCAVIGVTPAGFYVARFADGTVIHGISPAELDSPERCEGCGVPAVLVFDPDHPTSRQVHLGTGRPCPKLAAAPPALPWPSLEFDEDKVRAWVEETGAGDNVDLDEDDPWDHQLEEDGGAFLANVYHLVGAADDDRVFGNDRVRLYVAINCDSSGVMDGASVLIDIRPGADTRSVRLCSGPHEHSDLIDDRNTVGVDAAVSILRAVAGIAADEIRCAGQILGFLPPDIPAGPPPTGRQEVDAVLRRLAADPRWLYVAPATAPAGEDTATP